LRLTAEEGLALVSAGSVLLALPGADPEGALARALAKLETVLGVGTDEAVEVDLGPAAPAVLDGLRRAVGESRKVRLDYYSFGRDSHSSRVVQPWRVFNTLGQWYVSGWCETVEDQRLFRVDRVDGLEVLDDTFAPRPLADATPAVFSPDPSSPLVVLDLEPAAHWIAEQYPHEGIEATSGGALRVRLRVSSRAWLARVLLSAGPAAQVVMGDPTVRAEAATRVLERYLGAPERN
ncbi:MAG: WYL domain-containing protein, partial [Actinomycetota bacterium]|nr:WYL domain-containing protein [Actinomycetota bacterium]